MAEKRVANCGTHDNQDGPADHGMPSQVGQRFRSKMDPVVPLVRRSRQQWTACVPRCVLFGAQRVWEGCEPPGGLWTSTRNASGGER